ncbi:endonuclease [Sphingobium jiangsuense]|uniref:Endonuclease/exonuclease/phosphatase family metal-dependent hydrolase n=1 Tax=Sphingobium jiangsuense TaxID=870476 RepID=A0A7W6BR76_9SPHN|nr:endonuclease/exonuclease/phosphatase family protein [Sphingobium jiangsuense]MBB3926319.1 endonuclease/exonuclease/phosphatase family metal-dependent hydrolase [Sphingobium jiangsuense]GLS99701.1 endonuclease [Sphingobium jiangsuense]
MPDLCVRVASYNIHKGVGTDRRRNPERILAVLAEIDADIIALQEADRRFGPREAVLPPHLIERHSDYHVAPLNVQTDSIGWHGNSILVRKSATIHMSDIIHLPYLEPRGAVVAEVEFPGGHALRLYGMHLDLSGLWRRRQAHALLNSYAGADPMPTLMAGDLNEWRASGGCLVDFERHFDFAPCGQSFPSRRPVGRLDRIMVNERIELLDSGVHASLLARRASDHLPIWADLRLRQG